MPVLSEVVGDGSGFGDWLSTRMAEIGYHTNRGLGQVADIDGSLIGKWRRGEAMPTLANLRKLVDPLRVSFAELAARAGHLEHAEIDGPPPPVVVQHPLVRDLARLLGEDSPLSDDQRTTLEQVVTAVISPYRSMLRRRRRVS